MSKGSVIFLAKISSPKWTLNQLFTLLFPFPFECPRRECCWRGRRGESCGRSGETDEVGGVCETEAGTEADAEPRDEDVELLVAWTKVDCLDMN